MEAESDLRRDRAQAPSALRGEVVRVLVWQNLVWPRIGGAEVILGQFLGGMRRRGHEFVVVASHTGVALPDVTSFDGVAVHRFPFLAALENRDVGKIREVDQRVGEVLDGFAADLVHVHSADPSAFFLHRALAGRSLLRLMTVHSSAPFETEPNSLLGRLLRTATWLAAVSGWTLRHIRSIAPETSSRSSLVLNALEPPALDPAPLRFDPPVIVSVGRLIRDKGLDLALDAFAATASRFPGARLVIAGDGPERPRLEQQAVRLGIAASVEFLGWVEPDSVAAVLNRASVVIVPSRWQEPFGLVALQAAQLARPVVAANVGGLPEIVADGETGLLVAADDSAALARSLGWLLGHPEAARALGRAARDRALGTFSFERYLDSYESLYRQLASGAEVAL